MSDNKEMLGTAPIGKLLFKLAVPTVVAHRWHLPRQASSFTAVLAVPLTPQLKQLLNGTLGFNPNVKWQNHSLTSTKYLLIAAVNYYNIYIYASVTNVIHLIARSLGCMF